MFNCICVDIDSTPSDFGTRVTRVARKEHECGECGCTIRPGEIYEYAHGRCEDDWWDAKTCMTCMRIRNDVFQCGWYYGSIWDDIHEGYCDSKFCLCPPTREMIEDADH